MPSTTTAIVAEAKRLQRLMTKRRALNAQLRGIEKEIRLVRRHLRGLAVNVGFLDPDDQLPSRWDERAQ